ncbi:MAG TPA: hypothetical protein VNT79_18535 [Phycisphaerae bacterium]|nr:hypothetical protein [Phycisphaerae bacterium]
MSEALTDVLTVVCDALDVLAIPHAVTGAIVSSVYGEPVSSLDVEICLRMSPASARKLAHALPPRFYRDEEAMAAASSSGSMANLIDVSTGLKVDLSVLPAEPYYDSVMDRRRKVPYGPGGRSFWTVSPEDIILMKLLWRRDSRSQKQWENALSVVRAQKARLEWKYLHVWAKRLDLSNDLESLRDAGGV